MMPLDQAKPGDGRLYGRPKKDGSGAYKLGRHDLPRCVVTMKTVPMVSYDPERFERMVNKPAKPVPLPSNLSRRLARRNRNLAQYGGRSPEGRKRSLLNLRQCMKIEVPRRAEQLPAHIPQPDMPLVKLPVKQISQARNRYLRAILSKEEYDLFLLTWREWFEEHPEYDLPEDRHDIETICMESVMQYRMQILGQRHPQKDTSSAYHQSFRRAQQARENLAARRVDRTQKKGSMNVGTMNVSVMAGNIDEKKLMDLQQKAKLQEAQDMEMLDRVHTRVIESKTIESKTVSESEDGDGDGDAAHDSGGASDRGDGGLAGGL